MNRKRDRERQRETERDRERQRETERDRERQRETERDRESENIFCISSWSIQNERERVFSFSSRADPFRETARPLNQLRPTCVFPGDAKSNRIFVGAVQQHQQQQQQQQQHQRQRVARKEFVSTPRCTTQSASINSVKFQGLEGVVSDVDDHLL